MISDLTSDALRIVFSYTNPQDKCHRAGVVCRRWAEAAGRSEWYLHESNFVQPLVQTTWMHLDVRRLTLAHEDFCRHFFALCAQHPQAIANPPKALFIGCDVGPACWKVLSQMSPVLETLNVVTFTPVEGTRFPRLHSLTCNAVPRASSWEAIHGSALTELSLSHVSDASLHANMSKFPSLRKLLLVSCDSVTRVGFLAVARAPFMRWVRHLDLSSTAIDSHSLHSILKNCKSLDTLHLRDCNKLHEEDASLQATSLLTADAPPAAFPPGPAGLFAELKAKIGKVPTHVPKAHRDEVAEGGADQDAAAADVDEEDGYFVGAGVGSIVTEFAPLRETLTRLSLSGVGRLDDAGLRMVLDSLPHLTELSLSKNREITDDVFVSCCADGFPAGLKKLSLSSCVGLTDAALHAIADSNIGANLELIAVSNCRGMTAAGMTHLFSKCHNLRNVWAFMMLKKSSGNGLLPNSSVLINDAVMERMWTQLPHLESICFSFQPLGARAFSASAPHMIRAMEIDHCFTEPDVYLPIATHFPLLKKLSMPCKGVPVPDDVLGQMLERLPHLNLLRLCVSSIVRIYEYVKTSVDLNILDVEYSGTPEGFEYALWWECYMLAKKRSIKVFLGKYADKLLNEEDVQ